jgi:hypothetical protein
MEIANDLGPQQTHDVGTHRVLEAGVDFLSDGSTTDEVATFEHQYFLPRSRKVCCVD